MKKRLTAFVCIALLITCASDKKELYKITDDFVESLYTKYDAYDLSGVNYMKTTESGFYRVIPFGRLINVKILGEIKNDTYKDLKEDLKSYYRDDKRVHTVYLNSGGTVMIDCRN